MVGWSRLPLAPCGLSSLNKLTRHVLIVVSGEVCANTQDLSRPRLGSGTESLLHLLAKASQLSFKERGNRLHLLLGVVVKSHCKGYGYWEE